MGRPEARIEDRLRRRVKEEGGRIRKTRWISRRGCADNLVWWPGPRIAFVECKPPGEDVDWDSLQGREIKRMRADGWTVLVVNSLAGVEDAIKLIKGVASTDCIR